MTDFWLLVKCTTASLFPLELREILKCSALTGAHRIEVTSGAGVGEHSRVGGWSGGWDREVDCLWWRKRMVLPWNPALCFWVPVG